MKLKIVVIDKEECIRDTLKWHFEDLGHDVITCSHPISCDIYNGHRCQQDDACGDALVICDQMHGMSGIDFVDRLKQRGCRGITANILLMTGGLAGVDLRRAKALGCRIHEKPLGFDVLEEWLDGVKARIERPSTAVAQVG